MKRCAVFLAPVVMLAGCGGAAKERGVFPIAVHDAYQRLVSSGLADMKFHRQCGILIHVKPGGITDRSVTWRVLSSGEEQLSFTANLVPMGANATRVEVAVSKGLDGLEDYDGSRTYARPALRQPVRGAIEEQVAALLEGRPYDPERVPPAPRDTVCNVQRAGLESGTRFGIHDRPGMTSAQTAAAERNGR